MPQHNRTLRFMEGQTHTSPIRIQLELDVDLDAVHILDELPDRSRTCLVMVWQRPPIIILIGQGYDLILSSLDAKAQISQAVYALLASHESKPVGLCCLTLDLRQGQPNIADRGCPI